MGKTVSQSPEIVSTHSRAKAAARLKKFKSNLSDLFQHTAARRRLHALISLTPGSNLVSTHSRAKAAALTKLDKLHKIEVSTHSRAKAAAPYLKKQEKSAY